MDITTQFGTVKIKLLKGERGDQGIQGEQGIQGIQGEPFEFEDFTEQQLAELRADVATVYYRKLEETVYTIGDNTTSIEIPFEDYTTTDMLFVDIEGLTLTQDVDYTISEGSIVLATPITHHYTAVNFKALSAIAMSTEDFDNLTGDIDAKIVTEVDAWLVAHPEATTTVEDNSVTDAKLVQSGGILTRETNNVNAISNVTKRLLFESEVALTFANGDRGSTSGASVARTSTWYRLSSDLISVSNDDTFTLVNLRPDKYKFVIRGYTDTEANSGTFVSGGCRLLNNDGTNAGASTGWSNTNAGVSDNSICMAENYQASINYVSIILQERNTAQMSSADITEAQNCFKLYKTSPKVPAKFLPTIDTSKTSLLNRHGLMFGYGTLVVDTVNKTITCTSTFTVKYGSIIINGRQFDISNYDSTKYGTFYYDGDAQKIKWCVYNEYKNLSNVENTFVLGSSWVPTPAYFPNGYFAFNTNMPIRVNGALQLPSRESYLVARTGGLFGDSICYGQINGSTSTAYKLQDVIAQELGIPCTNTANGGAKYCRTNDRTDSLCEKVADDDMAYDLAVYFAGTNDWGYGMPLGTADDAASDAIGGTFCAAVKYCIETALTKNPDIQLAIVTPIFRSYHGTGGVGNTYTTIENQNGNTLGDFCDALVEIGELYNVPVLDHRKNSPVNFYNYASMLYNDGSGHYIHPLDATYKIMNHKIAKWLATII